MIRLSSSHIHGPQVLAENLLYGQIPHELSEMPSLEVFDVFRRGKSGPRLSGVLPSFDKLPQLTDLYLQGNSIQGSIPENFVSASRSLEVVRLGYNLLTGNVPESLGAIPALSLELEGNMIQGFPDSFCQKKDWMEGAVETFGCDGFLCPPGSANPLGRANVAVDSCSKCSKEGEARFFGSTTCDGSLSEREILMKLFVSLNGNYWYHNDFWGSTADVCDWYGIGCVGGHVTMINLSANNLRGMPVPDVFFLPELRTLWLYSNPIEFSFDKIGSAKKLEDLRLDSTMLHSLHGIGSATSLTSFDAGFAALRGSFPEQEILTLTNLRTLKLNNNNLSGTLPRSFGPLQFLVALRIDSNQLSGKVPLFDDLHFLEYVDASNNQLDGPVPRSLFDKLNTNVKPTVRLSHNQLTGVVPQELDRFADMSLYLSGNQILGLPVVLCDNKEWNNGDVGDFGCDAILCKPGSSNSLGRRTRDLPCQPCFTASYYGDTSCPGGQSSAVRLELSSWMITLLLSMVTRMGIPLRIS